MTKEKVLSDYISLHFRELETWFTRADKAPRSPARRANPFLAIGIYWLLSGYLKNKCSQHSNHLPPTHNCIFLSLQCPQNIPIESENVCAGCCIGKAQSKQPAATSHILKVCFGSVPIHGRGVQKDSFVQPENQ